jgi:hypothetical protein
MFKKPDEFGRTMLGDVCRTALHERDGVRIGDQSF